MVGAGGLGCEILKDLALSGFTDIHVIDLDTIDLSNLNRQFLFRLKDVGEPKAKVAAEFVMRRCPGVNVQWHNKRIQDYSPKWYTQFHFVIAGLDNVEAREWLNETLTDIVQFDEDGDIDWGSLVFFIDGGTEGFNGQTRVFVPHFTSCFRCSSDSMAPPRGFPVCTIKHVPRLPEHCIMFAFEMQWPLLESFTSATEYKMYEPKGPDDSFHPAAVKLDKDDPQHLSWIMHRAEERAAHFGIKGVTYQLTMQVVKSIIPAIASTNALISAACVNEVLKMRTLCSLYMDNFYMYVGRASNGINTSTFPYGRKPDCAVCHKRLSFKLPAGSKLSELVAQVQAEAEMEGDISISQAGAPPIYNSKLPFTHSNLDQPVSNFIKPATVAVASSSGRDQKFTVEFE